MKTLRALTLVAATFALVSIFAAQARAELIVDISVSSSLVTGSGFFEFDAPTGNFIDNLVDWEFTGEAFGHDFVFDDPDLFISGTYTSDEDWNLVITSDAQSVESDITTTPGFESFFPLFFAVPVPNLAILGVRCTDLFGGNGCSGITSTGGSGSGPFEHRAPVVAEPPAGAVFLIGLGALAMVARRRRRGGIGLE